MHQKWRKAALARLSLGRYLWKVLCSEFGVDMSGFLMTLVLKLSLEKTMWLMYLNPPSAKWQGGAERRQRLRPTSPDHRSTTRRPSRSFSQARSALEFCAFQLYESWRLHTPSQNLHGRLIIASRTTCAVRWIEWCFVKLVSVGVWMILPYFLRGRHINSDLFLDWHQDANYAPKTWSINSPYFLGIQAADVKVIKNHLIDSSCLFFFISSEDDIKQFPYFLLEII
jgi:hypothetical protein